MKKLKPCTLVTFRLKMYLSYPTNVSKLMSKKYFANFKFNEADL